MLGVDGEKCDSNESGTQDFLLINTHIMPIGTLKLFHDAIYYMTKSNPLIFGGELLIQGKLVKILNLIKNIPIIDKKQILATNYEQCQILGLESDENYILKIFNNNFNIFEILLHIKHPNQFIEQLILSKKYQLELSINNFYHYILNINFSRDIYKLLIKLNINDEAQLYLNYKQNVISNHVYSNDCLINNFHIAEKVCNPTIILNLLKHTNVYSLDITNFINNNEVLFETNFDLLKEFVVNYKKINLTDFTLLKKLFIYHITTNKKIVEIIKNNIHSILKECNYTVIVLILEYLSIDNISFSSKNINFDFILKLSYIYEAVFNILEIFLSTLSLLNSYFSINLLSFPT